MEKEEIKITKLSMLVELNNGIKLIEDPLEEIEIKTKIK